MADIDEKRFTIIKVIQLKEGSVTIAYSNYTCDNRWHFIYEKMFSRLTISGCLTIGRYEYWVKSWVWTIKTMKKRCRLGSNDPKCNACFYECLCYLCFSR